MTSGVISTTFRRFSPQRAFIVLLPILHQRDFRWGNRVRNWFASISISHAVYHLHIGHTWPKHLCRWFTQHRNEQYDENCQEHVTECAAKCVSLNCCRGVVHLTHTMHFAGCSALCSAFSSDNDGDHSTSWTEPACVQFFLYTCWAWR